MTDLPEPDAAARAHSQRVVAHIRAAVAAGTGYIPFSRYMGLALYAPGLGYYAAGSTKLGAAGDFITAPEMTPLFATALATQIAVILAATGRREIVELGAGSGRLAADLLTALAARDALPSRYLILEVSPDLAQRQRTTLERDAAAHVARVDWITALPATIDGALIANEVLDALPVDVVARRDEMWFERGVTWDDARSAFAWAERPADARCLAIGAARFPQDGDYASEFNPAAEALVEDIGRRLAGGAALFIDYGFPAAEFYHPQRNSGTLMCHYRHRAHGDPFAVAGLDRHHHARRLHRDGGSGRARGAFRRRLHRTGAVPARLRNSRRACRHRRAESTPYIVAAAAVQKLLAPSEMGELFKVLALAKTETIAWPGFGVADRRHRL